MRWYVVCSSGRAWHETCSVVTATAGTCWLRAGHLVSAWYVGGTRARPSALVRDNIYDVKTKSLLRGERPDVGVVAAVVRDSRDMYVAVRGQLKRKWIKKEGELVSQTSQ